MNRMLLLLKRSPLQANALDKFLADLQNPASVSYHQWLTPEQFGKRFGLSDTDLQKVTSWLESQGFTIAEISKGRTTIEFSGSANQVEKAFHTPIHQFLVNGQEHWANVNNPQIPDALAPAVGGITSLHDFVAQPQSAVVSGQLPATFHAGSPRPQFGSGGSQALAPADYATIYNINPLYQTGINGSGTTIAIVGRTNINVQDVNSFRSAFGLSLNPPHVIVNGSDPGNLGGGEELEAVLDTSWAGATAPNANVDLVVSASTNTTDGIFLSEEYVINNNLAAVMSESFGDCEANYTQASAATVSGLAQQAAAQGITFLVAAGDSGSAGCDASSQTSAVGPVSVNILASTPYTVAVGGTQFNDNANPGQYWTSPNGSTGGSAVSYVPEDVWNANCMGSQCGTGSILAGGGGRSQFYPKPSWQSGVTGIPSDGSRDVPDVALTAAGHDPYLLCIGGSCTPNHGQISFAEVYGTSASTPSFAGIMALVNQSTGSRQGQANVRLYSLAAASNLSSCNASNTGSLPATGCIFNDVTVGTNAVPGEPGYNTASETYLAGVGYDLATGLGSINATNLVNSWNGTAGPPPVATNVYSSSTVPAPYFADGSALELGVKFQSTISGYISGVRFYKNAADTSVHTGSLWTLGGQLLATGTFSNETGSGWQQLNFTVPVAIAANTTYVASYHTSSGFNAALNYFANQGVSNGNLTELQSGVSGSNGVYYYGNGGVFPTQSYENTNYFVDIVFSQTSGALNIFPAGTVPSTYFSNSQGVELGAKIQSTVSGYVTGVRFYKNSSDVSAHTGSLWTSDGVLVATGTFLNETASGWQQLNFANPVAIVPNTTYVASYHTDGGFYDTLNYFAGQNASNGPLQALQSGASGPNGVYIYGAGGIFPNLSYQTSNYWVDVAFSPTAGATLASSLFAGSPSVYQYHAGSTPVELGVKIRSDVSGYISAIRFYKNPADTTTHTGSLWSSSGVLLATGAFTSESSSGWQQMNFASPVAIAANTTYIASYHTGGGFNAALGFYAGGTFDNGTLHGLQDGLDGSNGLYSYGLGGIFPNQTYQSANYWVDVLFSPR